MIHVFSLWDFFPKHSQFPGQQGKGEAISNSSLPLPPSSQTLRHQQADYCRELTSAHIQQPDLNWEPEVSKHEPLTTKLHVYMFLFKESILLSEEHLPKSFGGFTDTVRKTCESVDC